ncbi:MAG: threonine--tRNA ligase [Myxococcales bacterium]|nr:threonine--tRNA ligase [Myxococcales bacterium]
MHEHDHRRAARTLKLLHFQDESPGMVFWHPAGRRVLSLLEATVQRRCEEDGYLEVRTPQMLRQPVWERSGHWDRFSEGLYRIDAMPPAALKPVSCPAHIEIARRMRPSHHELPLRLSELGLVHRHEPSGSLHGLFRLRQFTQDDGHVFCGPDQVRSEIVRFLQRLRPFYAAFGFDEPHFALSTRPAQRHGPDALWDRAESLLARAAEHAGIDLQLHPGGGAFYGPKIEVGLHDREGRLWQCGTIQLDHVLPERFGLSVVQADGQRAHPVLLHRALCGSLERFLGLVIERHEGRLPPWIAPEQIRVIPVHPTQQAAARQLCHDLRAAGVRATLDSRRESLARRVADATSLRVPWVAVLGAREASAGTVALRSGNEVQTAASEDAVRIVARSVAPPASLQISRA